MLGYWLFMCGCEIKYTPKHVKFYYRIQPERFEKLGLSDASQNLLKLIFKNLSLIKIN